jgi:hypothetical protein
VFVTALLANFAGKTLALNGGNYTPQQVKDKVDAYIALLAAATKGKAAWADQLSALDAAFAELDPLVTSAEAYVRTALGPTSAALTQYGLSPRKRAPRSAVQQVAITQKAAATRSARHTVGPKQKKAIHGAPATALAPSVKPGGDSTK